MKNENIQKYPFWMIALAAFLVALLSLLVFALLNIYVEDVDRLIQKNYYLKPWIYFSPVLTPFSFPLFFAKFRNIRIFAAIFLSSFISLIFGLVIGMVLISMSLPNMRY